MSDWIAMFLVLSMWMIAYLVESHLVYMLKDIATALWHINTSLEKQRKGDYR